MESLLDIAPQLAIALFFFWAFRWLLQHFDPHIVRLLNSIDDIRETGQRMADIGDRLVDIIETQQQWQEEHSKIQTERHRRIMERFDGIEQEYMRLLTRIYECHNNFNFNLKGKDADE